MVNRVVHFPGYILLFLFNITCFTCAVEVVEDLKLVQIIFRHGDRAPLSTYANDPHGPGIWKNGPGQLTTKGVNQQHQLGQFFRKRYAHFLGNDTLPSQVYIYSTDTDRTLQSAAAFSAGMFPPAAVAQWGELLGKLWRPVSIHTAPLSQERLMFYLLNGKLSFSCQKYQELYDNVGNLPENTELYQDYKEFFDWVVKQSGEKVVNHDMSEAYRIVNRVGDIVFCQNSNGFPLPVWLNETHLELFKLIQNVQVHLRAGANDGKDLARLGGGNFLKLILDRMKNALNESSSVLGSSRKAFIYSGHDNNFAAILSALDLYDFSYKKGQFLGIGQPTYAAAIILELFNNGSVRISLKQGLEDIANSEPSVLKHPNCISLCPLGSLIEVTRKNTVNDLETACGAALDGSNGLQNNPGQAG